MIHISSGTFLGNMHMQFKKDTVEILENDILPDGELNPGLPRDRRGYLPLYYRGLNV